MTVKFDAFLKFFKTLDYVKLEDNKEKDLEELQSSLKQVKLMKESFLNNLLMISWMSYNVIPTPDFKSFLRSC